MNLSYVLHCWPRVEFLEPEITFGVSVRADEISANILLFSCCWLLYYFLFIYHILQVFWDRTTWGFLLFIVLRYSWFFLNQRNCSVIIPFNIACPRFSLFFLQFLLNFCWINLVGSPFCFLPPLILPICLSHVFHLFITLYYILVNFLKPVFLFDLLLCSSLSFVLYLFLFSHFSFLFLSLKVGHILALYFCLCIYTLCLKY